jgi:hypothetical protein
MEQSGKNRGHKPRGAAVRISGRYLLGAMSTTGY